MNAHTIEYYDIDLANDSDPDPTFELTTTKAPTSEIACQLREPFVSLQPTDEPDKWTVINYENDTVIGTAYITKIA